MYITSLISLFYRHPDYFWHGVSAYYPLSEDELERYGDLLHWQFVSQNQNIRWTTPMVERFVEQLHWDDFSGNRFFADDQQINRFSSLVDWGFNHDVIGGSILNNPSIRWDQNKIERYREKISFVTLSRSEQVVWTPDLIDRYLKDWDWDSLSGNWSLPWSLDFFRRYLTFWPLDSMFFLGNQGITGCLEIVEEFWELLSSSTIFATEKLPWIQNQLLVKWGDKLNWLGLACNPLLLHQPGFFEQHIRQWEEHQLFGFLSENEGLPWTEEIFKRFIDRWDMTAISTNKALPWSDQFINRYEHVLEWGWHEWTLPDSEFDNPENIISVHICHSGLVNNEGLPWSLEFVLKHEGKIDFQALNDNPAAWENAFKPIVDRELIDMVFRLG
ncbi:hypothetical protein [Mangrovibacterium marinum]|uniref:hypothetical protein n=1 Tax=Mangrovibacterium marinum TaxID=1639118 RepID=UPI002A18DC60|nr:hypothetical protein [Mangrovibacterium marinum]